LAGRVRARLTAREGRRFGLTVGLAFLALAGVLVWRQHETAAVVCGALGALLALGALIAPTRLGPVERAWMALALLISRVTTPIFMGIVYFLVLTPMALAMRMAGKNPLRHRAAEGGYWVRRATSGEGRGDMTKKF
jgi:DMSO reductase anchor subunit